MMFTRKIIAGASAGALAVLILTILKTGLLTDPDLTPLEMQAWGLGLAAAFGIPAWIVLAFSLRLSEAAQRALALPKPFLYVLGGAGFSVAFIFAIAKALNGDLAPFVNSTLSPDAGPFLIFLPGVIAGTTMWLWPSKRRPTARAIRAEHALLNLR